MAGTDYVGRDNLGSWKLGFRVASYAGLAYREIVCERGIVPIVAPDTTRDRLRKARRGGPYDFMRRACNTNAAAPQTSAPPAPNTNSTVLVAARIAGRAVGDGETPVAAVMQGRLMNRDAGR